MQETDADIAQKLAFERKASEVAGQLMSELNKLASSLEPLEAYWLGRGGTACRSTSETIRNQMIRMWNALRGIAADVGTSACNDRNADEQQREAMQKVGSAAGEITGALRQA